jgi:hypothetical protein
MRTLFAVPWLSPGDRNLLIGLVSSLVVAAFALLKINFGGKRTPQELVTGSIQRSPVVASSDPMAAFLVTPSVAPATQGMKANGSWRFLPHTIAQTEAEQAMSSGINEVAQQSPLLVSGDSGRF